MNRVIVGFAELLDDGTLIVIAKVDMSKVGRVLLQNDETHYGDMFYPETEGEK